MTNILEIQQNMYSFILHFLQFIVHLKMADSKNVYLEISFIKFTITYINHKYTDTQSTKILTNKCVF